MVNRYLKCIKKNDWKNCDTKIGELLKITRIDNMGDFYIDSSCLSKERVGVDFELMPEGWTPNNVSNNHLLNLQIW